MRTRVYDVDSDGIRYYTMSGGGYTLSEVINLSKDEKRALRDTQSSFKGVVSAGSPFEGKTPLMTLSPYLVGDGKYKDVNNLRSMGIYCTNRESRWDPKGVNAKLVTIMGVPKFWETDIGLDVGTCAFKLLQAYTDNILLSGQATTVIENNPTLTAMAAEDPEMAVAVIGLNNSMLCKLFADCLFTDEDACTDNKRVMNVPHFNVTYRLTPYWRVPSTVLMNFSDEWPAEVRARCVRAHNITVTTWALTNGCLTGQMNRIADTTRVKAEVLQLHPESSRTPTEQDYENIALAIGFTKGKVRTLKQFYDILTVGTLPIDDPMSKLFSIEPTASAGITYPQGTKRKAVILSDVDYNQQIMELVYAGEDPANKGVLDVVFKGILSMKFVQVKPKYEVTKIEKLRTKVRNIFVYGSCHQVALGVACRMLDDYVPKPLDGSYSLAKFSPMFGGLDDVVTITLMRAIPPEAEVELAGCFYSDNAYFATASPAKEGVYDCVWYSTDVEKMESTSTIVEGRMVMEVICRVLGLEDSALKEYLKLIGGDFSHDAIGIIGNIALQVPGLSSGSQTTFLTNHLRMALAFTRLMAHKSELKGMLAKTKDGEKLPIPTGWKIFFNLEKTTDSSNDKQPGVFSNIEFVPLKLPYSAMRGVGSLEQCGAVVRLDLLGFDATPVKLTEDFDLDDEVVLCACLDYERLMKAVCFRKTKDNDKAKATGGDETGSVTNFVTSLVNIMTMQTLYIVGGYAYQDVDLLLKGCTTIMVDQLKHATNALNEHYANFMYTPEQILDELTSVIAEQAKVFLNGNLEDLLQIVDESVTEQLTTQILNAIARILEGDTEFIMKHLDREFVVRNFHTKTGQAARKAAKHKQSRVKRDRDYVPETSRVRVKMDDF